MSAADIMLNDSIVQSRAVEELYYSQGDIVHSSSEIENYDNFNQAFQNLTWNSASSFLVSQSIQSWGDGVLRMLVPSPGAGQSLAVPLGFTLINRFNIYIGSSVQFTLNQQSIFLSTISQCESADKIAKILSLSNGGYGLSTPIVGPLANPTIECIIPLTILFNSIYAAAERKGVPLDLTNNPMTIEVYLNPPSYFSTFAAGYTAYSPIGLNSGQLLAKTAYFKDRNRSLANYLKATPQANYYSPEIFIQQIQSPVLTASNIGGQPSVVNISNFRKTKCVGLWLFFLASSDDAGLNHLKTQQMTDIRVDKYGTILHISPGSSHQMKQLFDVMTPFEYDSYGVLNNPVFINFCQDAYFMSGAIAKSISMNDGYILQGSTLNISFAVNAPAPVPGILYLHVLYQGFMVFQNGLCTFVY